MVRYEVEDIIVVEPDMITAAKALEASCVASWRVSVHIRATVATGCIVYDAYPHIIRTKGMNSIMLYVAVEFYRTWASARCINWRRGARSVGWHAIPPTCAAIPTNLEACRIE